MVDYGILQNSISPASMQLRKGSWQQLFSLSQCSVLQWVTNTCVNSCIQVYSCNIGVIFWFWFWSFHLIWFDDYCVVFLKNDFYFLFFFIIWFIHSFLFNYFKWVFLCTLRFFLYMFHRPKLGWNLWQPAFHRFPIAETMNTYLCVVN